MLLLEGIGTIVFGLWVISHGIGPGESIMIVLGLPVVLFGVGLTIIGFAKSMKEKTPDVSELGSQQSPTRRDFVRTIENDVSFSNSAERPSLARQQEVRVRPERIVQERQSRKKACPECGAKYGLIDLMGQPTMCSKCWKKTKSSSVG
jgi:hypothetical protein